ncbi:MAG: RDD family protein [Actinomycetota bacterium]
MSNMPPPPPMSGSWGSTPGGPPVPSSVGRRVGATLLDALLIVVTLFIGWFVWSIVLWKQSTSPAKKMLGMQIVDANTGAPATMHQMVMREVVGKWVVGSVAAGLANVASFVMLFITPKRQGVWDYIGGTTVVDL